jgi:hypothetical protein
MTTQDPAVTQKEEYDNSPQWKKDLFLKAFGHDYYHKDGIDTDWTIFNDICSVVACEKDEQFKKVLNDLISWLDGNRLNNTIWRMSENEYNDHVINKVVEECLKLEARQR